MVLLTEEQKKINKKVASQKYAKSDKCKATTEKRDTPEVLARRKEIRDTPENKEKQRISQAKYDKTDKGKAAQKKYHTSPEGIAARKKYTQSDKGKAAMKKGNDKFTNKPEGRKYRMIHNWKTCNIITDDWDAIYEKYMATTNCELCDCILTPNKKRTGKCLDHNHYTGEIRNVLCFACNVQLGFDLKKNTNRTQDEELEYQIDRVVCDCGCDVSGRYLKSHKKSQKHKTNMAVKFIDIMNGE
jgi:hypothetical protein